MIRVSNPQRALVVAALAETPLDRIRLMKTLFLAWYRAGKPSDWPFSFEPYSYGPCSFAVYSTLDFMLSEGLVVHLPEGNNRGRYFLTERGKKEERTRVVDRYAPSIKEIARWAAGQSFNSLLSTVYREAPEFATRSVVAKQVLS